MGLSQGLNRSLREDWMMTMATAAVPSKLQQH
jgi:hypothetical protein